MSLLYNKEHRGGTLHFFIVRSDGFSREMGQIFYKPRKGAVDLIIFQAAKQRK